MAAFELLLSQARRHCLSKTPSSQFSLIHLLRSHSSPNPSFLNFHRSLCSSTSESPPIPETQPNEPTKNPQPIPLQVVAYPVKSQQNPTQHSDSIPDNPRITERPITPEASRQWNREDFRYVKDISALSPVAYPTRVAPLPEDRVEAPLVTGEENSELERERKRIEADERVRKRVFRVVEEEKLPYPTLIKVDQGKKKEKVVYDLKEAIQLLKANSKRNFDETFEAHVKMTPDLRRTDLKLNGTASLPHGTGKAVKIAVFAEGAAADEARAAGADVVGGEELIEGIKNGNIKVDFDKCISTPQLMSRVSKEISKILRRSTPNAKDGTVTSDLSRVVREAKQNVNFRKDKSAIVHVGLGKVSFPEDALRENVGAFVNALLLAKPAGLKKSSKFAGYVSTFHLCSTMGPSYPISIQSLSIAADRYNKLQMR